MLMMGMLMRGVSVTAQALLSAWGVVTRRSQFMPDAGCQGRFLLLAELFRDWKNFFFFFPNTEELGSEEHRVGLISV